MRFALLCALAPVLVAAADGPKIFYSKSFPGSVPPFVAIEITKEGAGVYQEAVNDDRPVKFQVAPEDVTQIFLLADKLDHFQRPLESGLKVANMGMKTFRYEDRSEKHEVKFNYSQDEDVKLLYDWFERLTETQVHLFDLERSVRFDKLGVNKTLLQVEAAWDRKRLIGCDRFLPMLDRVAKNEAFLHMARERAASLAETFRAQKVKAE
ncbi:MAG TPA: hypothetical protein VMZ52_06805 [Bryobacteraceae bacterium]|nr:hypothetical protein [Bryobacteraceae bacterium]